MKSLENCIMVALLCLITFQISERKQKSPTEIIDSLMTQSLMSDFSEIKLMESRFNKSPKKTSTSILKNKKTPEQRNLGGMGSVGETMFNENEKDVYTDSIFQSLTNSNKMNEC